MKNLSAHPETHPRGKARVTALAILTSVFRERQFAHDILSAVLDRVELGNPDRALIHELVYGVLRHRLTLDWCLNRVATRSMDRLPLVIALILRLAAYQLLYLTRIPASAAVDEAVAMARKVRGRDWRGFVNAVLRTLARQPEPPWPDLATDPCTALSLRYSCPPWMVERWHSRWGIDGAQTLCRRTVQIPPMTVRTNTLRCTRDALAERFAQKGYAVRETRVSPVGLILEHDGPTHRLDVWQEGWCYAEDEAAQLIPLLLDVQPGHRVLDLCAAPGGKTTHIAQLTDDKATIVAVDQAPHRLEQLSQNCRRLGITSVIPLCCDLTVDSDKTPLPQQGTRNNPSCAPILQKGFNRILVDAPCSGFGVLRRHPEGKWFKTPESIQQSQHRQRRLLECAAHLLRPEGILVYSVCSTEPEETHAIIEAFLHQHPEFRSESVEPWLPAAGRALANEHGQLFTPFSSLDMDGFFAARLRKVSR